MLDHQRVPSPDSGGPWDDDRNMVGGGWSPAESDIDSGIIVLGRRSTSSDSSCSISSPLRQPPSHRLDIPTPPRSKRRSSPFSGSELRCKPKNPPPLSVFRPPAAPEEDQGNLSQHTLRRSCRKLFATLYGEDLVVQGRARSNSLPQSAVIRPPAARSNSVPQPVPVHPADSAKFTSHVKECIQVLRRPHSFSMVEVYAQVASVIPVDPSSDSNHSADGNAPKNSSVKTEGDPFRRSGTPKPCRNPKLKPAGMDGIYSTPFETDPLLAVSPKDTTKDVTQSYHSKTATRAATAPKIKSSSSDQHLSVSPATSPLDGGVPPKEVEYAVVDKNKKKKTSTSLPVLSVQKVQEEPPVPPKKFLHKSDFALYQKRGSSLLERVGSMARSAKNALQRALSTERVYRPEKEERREVARRRDSVSPKPRSSNLRKGIKSRISFKKKEKVKADDLLPQQSFSPQWRCGGDAAPQQVWGQLLQLNVDGSQVVELVRPHGKPFGFFLARGRVRDAKGVFVSRVRDDDTRRLLAGLIEVGDEILEINGTDVKEATIMEVNNLMSRRRSVLLTVLPFISRKDI